MSAASQAAPQQPHGDGDPGLDDRDTDYDLHDGAKDFDTRPDWSAGGCSDGKWLPPSRAPESTHPAHLCMMCGNWYLFSL